MSQSQSTYTVAEEFAHAVTHGAGFILSIGGLSWMLYLSIAADDSWRIVASVVYGVSLISLFLASTLYHSFVSIPAVAKAHTAPNIHQPVFVRMATNKKGV
jgi:channel protein (hemolysin III family)